MKFDFEKFTDTDSTFSARVTIRQRTGQIGFNAGAINRFKVRDFRFVVLYFDKNNRVVGIQLTNEEGEGTIGIKQSDANTYITSKNFLDKYGVDYDTSHRHKLCKDEESGLLFFSLDDREEGDDGEDDPEENETSRSTLSPN